MDGIFHLLQASKVYIVVYLKKNIYIYILPVSGVEDAVEAAKQLILKVSSSEWKKCFENWFECMEKCENLYGVTIQPISMIYNCVFFIRPEILIAALVYEGFAV